MAADSDLAGAGMAPAGSQQPAEHGLAAYVSSLAQIPSRFRERAFQRSMSCLRTGGGGVGGTPAGATAATGPGGFGLTTPSGQVDMRRDLGAADAVWLGIGGIIGAGVFVITGVAAANYAGPAVVLSYIIAAISAMLSAICYTEFSIDIPLAGGAFSYVMATFGEFPAWISVMNLLMEYVLAGAAVARSFTSYLATLFGQQPNAFRIDTSFAELDPIAVVLIAVLTAMLCYSTKSGSHFNFVITVANVAAVVFVIVAGLTQADGANYTPFAPFGIRGIFNASALVFFSYIGFDSVATLAEEVKRPERDLPVGMIGSVAITTVLYVLMCVTISLMVPYTEIDTNAPFSVAFKSLGMQWAASIVSLGAVLGIVTSLLVNIVGASRVVMVVSRARLLPARIAAINPKRQTPIFSTVLLSSITAIIAFFTALETLANMVSIGILFVFFMVACGIIFRRYHVSGSTDAAPALIHLFWIVASGLGLALYYQFTSSVVGIVGFGLSWVLACVSLQFNVPEAYEPTTWKVPLMPWLPATSIALNLFLLATLDGASYIRFGVWTVVSVAIYLLYSLHAPYTPEEPPPTLVRVQSQGEADAKVMRGSSAASSDFTMVPLHTALEQQARGTGPDTP